MLKNELKGLKIALTGYEGFIGRWFVKTLRALDVPVLLLEGDVRCDDTWNAKFDVLYHFAAMLPQHFKENPEEAMSVNVDGVTKALESCRRNNAQMIFTSTCGVYKPGGDMAYSEGHPVKPSSEYTRSKLKGEMLCRSYAEDYGVKSTVLRLFNVYGPGQGAGYIIPYLIKCGYSGQTATVYHPDSLRDFIYVTDVMDALVSVVNFNEMFSIFNIGSGKCYAIREVIDVIEQVCNKKLKCSFIKGTDDPQPYVCANISKAGHDLVWSTKMSFKEGVQSIITDFQNVVNKE